ncbi:MAG TPA: polyprenyl synthetase family protein [Amnibacterium sp.]|uniref:polyprenyl synthetase family protein n=1 Tax=Amnibacterium sp. TaxID=1872496 RepID=UPI002F94B0D5
MSSRTPVARRSKSLSAQIGLTERLFVSAGERALAARIEDGLEEVEQGLLQRVSFDDSFADVTSRYLLAAGGKRVRPLLTLLTAQLGEGITTEVLLAAEAVEITHLASLYHDDVMDEAEQRRGVPSAQTVWGNSVAILTGDLLFARASKLIASIDGSSAVSQTETFERLVLGQLHETIGPQRGEDPVEHYLQVLRDKTGSLIAAAAEWGAMFSHAPEEYRQPLAQFGERIGVAFQLVDDVIDLAPQEAHTGKIAGTDLRAGVPTLPLLYLRRRALTEPADEALLLRIDQGVDGADDRVLESAIADLRTHDVTAETTAEAHRWAADAVGALDALPEGAVKRALVRFADLLVDRSS